jgi:hypothetical protein
MTKEIIKIDEITSKVSGLTEFNVKKEELEKKVEETKDITVDNLEDKNQIERAKRARLDLRNIEIDIEKTGKSFRDIFTKVNKDIMSKEKELLAITNPEVGRLKDIEEEAKKLATRKEREMILPYRREKLAEVDNVTEDEVLLEMNDDKFASYLLEKINEKEEKEKLAKEEAEREEQKQKEIEEAREQAKREAEAKAKEEIERVKREAKEKEERELREREEAEAKVKEEEERLAKEKDYKKFLSDNGYNEKEFKIIKENNEVKLYKLVATYTIK